MLEAQAALVVGNLSMVEAFFSGRPTIADIREGEISLLNYALITMPGV